MRHAISMQHLRATIQGRHTSLLYTTARPELDPRIASKERNTRSRMEDYAERQWMKLDNTFRE